mmetsp:Transcript_2118/g.8167  ORF Transcript_2118/g.8167 Transcript_2118/m.8167 type:complete len:276 (-) Transcript_2118:4538-5365(-)
MALRDMLSEFTTAFATSSLKRCRDMTFSSRVPFVSKRYTFTVRFCPKRCARSMACRSFCGFQSCSRKTTVSALVRFKPNPPTCVVSSKTSIDGSALNFRTTSNRAVGATPPSSLNHETPPSSPRDPNNSSSTRSKTAFSCEKIKTRCPAPPRGFDPETSSSGSSLGTLSTPTPQSSRICFSARNFGLQDSEVRAPKPFATVPFLPEEAGAVTRRGCEHSLRRYCSAWKTCAVPPPPPEAPASPPFTTVSISVFTALPSNASYSFFWYGDRSTYTS